MGAGHQHQAFPWRVSGDDAEVFEDVARGHVQALGRLGQAVTRHGRGLNLGPVLVAAEQATLEHRGARLIAVDDFAVQQTEENRGRLEEDLTAQGRPRCGFDLVACIDAVGAGHEFEPARSEADVEASFTARVNALEVRQGVGDALSLSDRSAGGEDGQHGAAKVNARRGAEGFQSQLGEIGAQANLARPMRHHGAAVALLDFGGQVRLSDPRHAETEVVRQAELIEVVLEHLGFTRHRSGMVRRMRDGEEDVVVHSLTCHDQRPATYEMHARQARSARSVRALMRSRTCSGAGIPTAMKA